MIKISTRPCLLLLTACFLVVCCNNDDPQPVVEPIPLEDEILGDWEFELGELYEAGNTWASLTVRPTDDCSHSNEPRAALIRPIDVRILTDNKYITLIMTECLERTVQYTHTIAYNDYRLTVVDSTIQPSGNPMLPFRWRVKKVDDTHLEMWRIAPEEASMVDAAGARMLYKFTRND